MLYRTTDAETARIGRFGREALLFTPLTYVDVRRRHALLGGDAPAYQARIDGWSDALPGSLGIAKRAAGESLEGVVFPVSPEQLQNADRAAAPSGLKRAIAMVEVDGGTRTWAFVYTRG